MLSSHILKAAFCFTLSISAARVSIAAVRVALRSSALSVLMPTEIFLLGELSGVLLHLLC